LDLDDKLRDFLQGVFACSTEIATAIGDRASARSYALDAPIVRQGDPGREAFLLIAGRAEALLYDREGHAVLIQEFQSGDLFGAIAEREPDAHATEVVAIEPTRAAIFLALDFIALIEAHACVGLAVSRMLLRQLRAATDRMAERATLSAAGRVQAALLRMADPDKGHVIRPAPVVATLAKRVHTTRETASRTLSALERRGLIRRDRDSLVIVAPARLRDMIV
jgi:CRP/FNR family transcriptional regulator, cyclic AMP receptor protein